MENPKLFRKPNRKEKQRKETTVSRIKEVPLEDAAGEFAPEESEMELTEREEIEALLDVYNGLANKLKLDIIADIKEKRKDGYSFKQIMDRLDLLAEKGYELMELGSEDSDIAYKPKPEEEDPDKEENEARIDSLKEELEEIAEKEKVKPPEKEDWIN